MNNALQLIINIVRYFFNNIKTLLEWLTTPILSLLPGWLNAILQPILSQFHLDNLSPFNLVLDGLIVIFLVRLINKIK